jgi:tRNA(Ile)-lysidine synthase TilS/MesJ
MPSNGISNLYIDKILTPRCADFKGTFSADTIPKQLCGESVFSLICNLSKEKETGTHFITIIARPNFIIYIDSVGLACTNQNIRVFMANCKRKMYYNTNVIQHPLNDFCGYFCMLYCLWWDSAIKNKPVIKFHQAPHKYAENNQKCIQYIATMLKEK